jgi:integrase/recombinase XerD
MGRDKLFIVGFPYQKHNGGGPVPRGESIPEFLKEDDARRLLETPYLSNVRDRIILGLMLKCGLRAGELVPSRRQGGVYERGEDGRTRKVGVRKWMSEGIKKKHFTFDEFRQTASIKVAGGKGSKDRMVPVPLDLALLIKDYSRNMDAEDVLFDMSVSSIDPLVKRYARRANITERVWPHKLRHTFAVNALRSGWNIKEVQQALGHEHLSTTEVYLHVTDEEMATTHKRHPLPY